MNPLGGLWKAIDWRKAWQTPAPLPRSVPLDLAQSRLEVWQFAKNPARDPRQAWISNSTRQALADPPSFNMGAFHRDRLAAHIHGLTNRGKGKSDAWSVGQAQRAAQAILEAADEDMDVWVLEHTTQAKGVRGHHKDGTWTLFENAPQRMLSAEMLAQAGRWLWAIKQRELSRRPAMHPLRASLALGREAMDQVLDGMAWDWNAVMDVVDTLHHIAYPVEPYFLPDSPWYSTAPIRQKAWLDIGGTFGGEYHQWQELSSMAEAVTRLCKAIPAEFVRDPTDEERALAEKGLATEPWDGFSRVVELIPYWTIPCFWLAHKDAASLWTDPRARAYWGAAFGESHFKAGDEALAAQWAENPHGREENWLYPRPEWENPHGCVDFLTVPLDMFHQEWGKRLFPLLPKALQYQALDEALFRVAPTGGTGRRKDLETEEVQHLQWLKETAPDWPRWALADLAIDDYPAYLASLRLNVLEQRLDETAPTGKARPRL